MRKFYACAGIVFLIVVSTNFLFAQSPGKFNYQAVVRDGSGMAISTQVDIRFQIFDNAVAGNQVYQEDFSAQQPNSFGVVNLQIGSGTPSLGNLLTIPWQNGNYFINILMRTSNGGNFADISNSRTQLVSVPYSLYSGKTEFANKADSSAHANIADTVLHTAPQTAYTAGNGITISNNQIINTAPNQTITITAGSKISITGTYPNFTISSTDSTPAGTIVAYGGSTTPTGWLLCDGSSYTNSAYPALAIAIGSNFGGSGASFNVPDFRGRFLRGVDGTLANNVGLVANNDPDHSIRTAMNTNGQTGNHVGSVEGDEVVRHTHTYTTGNGAVSVALNSQTGVGGDNGQSTLTTAATGGSETRPKNAYVNYIIKY